MESMVRPNVDDKVAMDLAHRLWGIRGRNIVQLNGYDDKNFWIRDVEIVENPNIPCVYPDGYVLKVTNSLDSKGGDVISGQNLVLQNLGPLHAVRLMTFVPGEILNNVPWNPQFSFEAGQHIAKVNKVFQSCKVAALERRILPWALWSASECALPHTHVVEDESDRAIVVEVLTSFENEIISKTDTLNLSHSLIHGDYNEQNVVVRQNDKGAWFIAALLDLGDCHRAPLLFEVAITACYMALKATVDGIEAAEAALRDVVKGFREAGGSLSGNEVNILMLCVCARLAQSLVLGLKAHCEDPANEYVLSTQRFGWPLLRHLWQSGRVPRSHFQVS